VKPLCALAFVLAVAACSHTDHMVTQVVTPPDTLITTIPVVFPQGTISAKIAATAAARDTGLMNVTNLGADAGMLFVFGENHDSTTVAFWMEDTPTALSIAFIDSTMAVINIEDMAPETTTLHFSARAFRYALETNQGWFTAHGVTAGTVVSFTLPSGTVIDP
jgi:uncharacterized protein